MVRIISVALLVASVFFFVSPTHNLIARAESLSCAFDPQTFAALQTIKQEGAGAIQAELKIRKKLLAAVLECLREEIRAERADLNRTNVEETGMRAVQNHLVAALEEAMRYYDTNLENVPNVGLYASKEMAANLREWRNNTFSPQQTRIRAFKSWVSNEEFIATAVRRLEELGRSVQILKIVDRSKDIQSLLDNATAALRGAQDFQARARATFVNGLDPSASLKLSLEALADAYRSFIDLSSTINTLLPSGKEK